MHLALTLILLAPTAQDLNQLLNKRLEKRGTTPFISQASEKTRKP